MSWNTSETLPTVCTVHRTPSVCSYFSPFWTIHARHSDVWPWNIEFRKVDIQFLKALVFALLSATDVINLPEVYILAGVLGIASALDQPTRQAFLSELVGADHLPNAGALNSIQFNMINLLLDYPVAAFDWADHGDGNPSLADVKARTARAVMGGIDQTRLHEMSLEEVTAQARQAVASVPRGLFLTAGCAIRPETPAAIRKALAASAQSL